ncbi:uncharacterized protein BDR25DRAFT_306076 [Lindgomyces ingoldianus]|uniref:Uncharacterized protein n=1 Tax=Lindgomyces ingoldianus TaxID=673940 RepID=A0ACB6QIY7_9PLEO|nr:uncharacterized protein BDR25DRAFT_306076 [Lindgomyces ingoldianus]KAF2466553.1 hypothetical protein BDR25DRAFT_306076 [Lindgomyces ingoldianus]
MQDKLGNDSGQLNNRRRGKKKVGFDKRMRGGTCVINGFLWRQKGMFEAVIDTAIAYLI